MAGALYSVLHVHDICCMVMKFITVKSTKFIDSSY